MTYEEAKNIINNSCVRFGRSQGKTLFIKALTKAVEAIEKQIPREPKAYSLPFMLDNGTLAQHLGCENCKSDFMISEGTKHCPRCGQALDWGGAND